MQQYIEKLPDNLAEIKKRVIEYIETYIEEKIILAQAQICKLGSELLSRKRKETIMIIGSNIAVEQTLLRAAKPQEKDKERADFSVIVVDTCPSFSGREVAKRLTAQGIECKYTLI